MHSIISYTEDGKLQKTPQPSCDSKAGTTQIFGERFSSGFWPHIMRVWYHPHQLHGCLVNKMFSLRILSFIKDHRVRSFREQCTISKPLMGNRLGSAPIHFNASTLIRNRKRNIRCNKLCYVRFVCQVVKIQSVSSHSGQSCSSNGRGTLGQSPCSLIVSDGLWLCSTLHQQAVPNN